MKKHKRALSLLLIICIMCCAFFGSLESANALVLNPWTIALCGTILCAMGLTFTDTSAFEAAANSFASSLDAQTLTLITDSATTLASGVSDGIFTVTQSIVDALMNWLVSVSPQGGIVSLGNYVTFNTSSLKSGDVLGSYPASQFFTEWNSNSSFTDDISNFSFLCDVYGIGLVHYSSWDSSLDNKVKIYSAYKTPSGTFSTSTSSGTYPISDSVLVDLVVSSVTSEVIWLKYVFSIDSSSFHTLSQGFSLSAFPSISVLDGVSSIPFDDVWAPGSSDEEKALVAGTDVVVPGGIVNSDGVLASDVIVGMSAANVRANSGVNTDVVAGTGTITGTGEGTGIFEGIGSLVLDIPIIGTIASTLSGILEAIRGFFDVSKFDLNFDSLKIGLTKVFPFCIPFDFFNAIKMFSSDASAFVFDINLETEYFTIDHTVDLTPFRLPILFFRYVVVFWFGFILISRTKDFMKW